MILVDKICLASYPCYGYDDYIAGYAEITSYFNAFYENFGTTIDYDWQTIDAISYLIFTDEDGDKLYYTEENLSISELAELDCSIYRNPMQDVFHIYLAA